MMKLIRARHLRHDGRRDVDRDLDRAADLAQPGQDAYSDGSYAVAQMGQRVMTGQGSSSVYPNRCRPYWTDASLHRLR